MKNTKKTTMNRTRERFMASTRQQRLYRVFSLSYVYLGQLIDLSKRLYKDYIDGNLIQYVRARPRTVSRLVKILRFEASKLCVATCEPEQRQRAFSRHQILKRQRRERIRQERLLEGINHDDSDSELQPLGEQPSIMEPVSHSEQVSQIHRVQPQGTTKDVEHPVNIRMAEDISMPHFA